MCIKENFFLIYLLNFFFYPENKAEAIIVKVAPNFLPPTFFGEVENWVGTSKRHTTYSCQLVEETP